MKRTGLFAVCIAAAVLAGCHPGTKDDSAEPQALSVTDARKAELLTAIGARYENPEAHYELGKIYHQEGLLERAEFHYNVAMGFDPMNRRAQAAMVKLMQDRKDPQRAAIVADTYINQASTSAESLMALGRGFQREGLDSYALQCYQEAQNLSPNSASIYKQLGYYFLNKGDSVRAESYLRRSFEIDSNQPDIAAELGRMGIRVQVPPRKSTGILGTLGGKKETDETIK